VAVVTTSVGAQGLHAVSGEHLLIADETTAFSSAVAMLLHDRGRCERIGLTGQEHIAKICGPERVERSLDELLGALDAPRRSLGDWVRWRGIHATLAVRSIVRRLA